MEKRLGRIRPTAIAPRLKLRNYLDLRSLPSPPAECDYGNKAIKSLSDIYDNDTVGDCVIAGIAHIVGTMTGNSGSEFLFTSEQIIKLYGEIGGYVPGDESTDNGCDEQVALHYWMNKGAPVGENKILGDIGINPNDPNEQRVAVWLFENLMFGMALPDEWLNIEASGFVWDLTKRHPNPLNGHCYIGYGYNAHGVKIDTWGLLGTITDRAIHKYVTRVNGGMIYSVISEQLINKASKKAPCGFCWQDLVSDFDKMGGDVEV